MPKTETETLVYAVAVRDEYGTAVNEETFAVGNWREIGYWLDNCGYIERGYLIETRVIASTDA